MAYLSKVNLKNDKGSTGTLIDILRRDRGLGGEHRLVWTLFSEDQHLDRDFLFRRAQGDGWLVLSQRKPVDVHNIWNIETKDFSPKIKDGDKLAFRLRANPRIGTVSSGGRRVKHDFIQNERMRLRLPDGSLPPLSEVLPVASHDWISRQAERSGFSVEPNHLLADCYVQQQFPARTGAGRIQFRSLDLKGILQVQDASRFVQSVLSGFGGARAYGFGLMILGGVSSPRAGINRSFPYILAPDL
jgi:CRISPR system Cascade subunit CasE